MKHNKFVIGIGVVAVVALVFSLFAAGRPNTVTQVIEKTLGAFPGPEITLNDISIGGIWFRYDGKKLAATSSVICSSKSPASTSSLQFAGISGTNLAVATTLY